MNSVSDVRANIKQKGNNRKTHLLRGTDVKWHLCSRLLEATVSCFRRFQRIFFFFFFLKLHIFILIFFFLNLVNQIDKRSFWSETFFNFRPFMSQREQWGSTVKSPRGRLFQSAETDFVYMTLLFCCVWSFY